MTEGAVDVGAMTAEFDTAGASAAVKAAVEAADTEAAAEAGEETEAPAEKAPDTDAETPAAKKGKDKEPPAEEPAQTASEIQRVLKEREARRDAQREIAEMRAAAHAEAAEAKRLRAEIEQERAFYAELRTKPIDAIRKSGWNPDDLILSLAKAGTPEGQLAERLEAESRARAGLENQLKEFLTRDEQRQRQAADAANEASIQAAEQRFLGFTQNEETCPTLARLFKGREHVIIAEGHRVARAYHAKTGQIPNERDIAEYLESEWAVNGSATTTPAGKAPQRRASGSASVTPAEASERRTVAKSVADMSDEDRLREARAAAAKAIKEANGTR